MVRLLGGSVLLLLLSTVRGADDCPDFECPDKDGSFADPCTCRRFYQCVEYFPYRNNCPSGLYFDDIKKFCTFKNEAVCGPVTTTPAPITTPPPDKADKCDPEQCKLPFCYCSSDGTQIPGGLNKDDIPQMVMIMLDGAVNTNNNPFYRQLFRDRKNPNGCKIKGTFFLTHHYANYFQIEKFKNEGHEMAIGSITDDNGLFQKNSTAWGNEIAGLRKILGLQANIGEDEVLGIRAPGLIPGFNAQYDAMIDYGFIWDSSIGVPPTEVPIWPYTLDYKIPHKCKSDSCPTRQFPGIWEIPLNSHHVEGFVSGHCPYLDQCVFTHQDSDDVYEWLKEDFLRHYNTNKAPYTLALHTNWFTSLEQRRALDRFMNFTETLNDVYYVTATQALLWMTEPVKLEDLEDFSAWTCNQQDEDKDTDPCVSPNKCALSHTIGNGNKVVKYMTTCKTCPGVYPWLCNAAGRDTDEDRACDEYPKFSDQ